MNNLQGSSEFEAWWEETYKGKLISVPIKEIALTAWTQAIEDLEEKLKDIQQEAKHND